MQAPEQSLSKAALFRQLDAAARAGSVEAAREALSLGADPNHPPLYGGDTPLMIAAQDGNLELAKALLEAGADPNARAKPAGGEVTALSRSVEPSSPQAGQVAGLLLRYGADPWAKVQVRMDWTTAVDMAIAGNRRHALFAWATQGLDIRAEPEGGTSLKARLEAAYKPGLVAELEAALAAREKDELAQACAPAPASSGRLRM